MGNQTEVALRTDKGNSPLATVLLEPFQVADLSWPDHRMDVVTPLPEHLPDPFKPGRIRGVGAHHADVERPVPERGPIQHLDNGPECVLPAEVMVQPQIVQPVPSASILAALVPPPPPLARRRTTGDRRPAGLEASR